MPKMPKKLIQSCKLLVFIQKVSNTSKKYKDLQEIRGFIQRFSKISSF